MSRFLYQMHVMWYEVEMVPETLDSLSRALQYASIPVDIKVCFNKQTFLEQPVVDNINESFDKLSKHPVLENASIVEKTNEDGFFNVGDWRREVRTTEGYTIWGESDTLVPNIYFPLIEQIWGIRDQLQNPHVLSLASRKMWDASWLSVEHPAVHNYNVFSNGKSDALRPLGHDHYITQEELDVFNNQYADDVGMTIVHPPKLDGSMLALHPNVPQLIADDVPMVGEDFCAQLALTALNIPQYHIGNIIKGHNYHHPTKRVNTLANRNEHGEVIRGGDLFDQIKKQSQVARDAFIGALLRG